MKDVCYEEELLFLLLLFLSVFLLHETLIKTSMLWEMKPIQERKILNSFLISKPSIKNDVSLLFEEKKKQ